MRKLLLILLLLPAWVFAQTTPIAPLKLNQMQSYKEPSTGLIWLGLSSTTIPPFWYVIPDSTYIKKYAGGGDTISFKSGQFVNTGTATNALIGLDYTHLWNLTSRSYPLRRDSATANLLYDTSGYIRATYYPSLGRYAVSGGVANNHSGIYMVNGNSGTGAVGSFRLLNNLGYYSDISQTSSTYTTTGLNVPNSTYIRGTGTTVNIGNENASGVINFYLHTSAVPLKSAQIDANGYWHLWQTPAYTPGDSSLYIKNGLVEIGPSSSGSISTLNNGLTLTGSNGQLGGALTQNTTITEGIFKVNFSGNDILVNGVTVGKGPGATGSNTTLGAGAGKLTGADETAVGFNALAGSGNAGFNTAIGGSSLSVATGGQNTAVGYNSLGNATTPASNTAMGWDALSSITTGGSNTAFGHNTGASETTGTGSVFLGADAGASETASNKLYIANTSTTTPLIKGDFSAETVQIYGTEGAWTPTGTAGTDSVMVKHGNFYYAISPSYYESGRPLTVNQTTLISGTKAITISGLTTSSIAIVSVVSQGGTSTTTWKFAGVCTSNTLTITAITTTGTTNTSDTSVINYEVFQ